MERAARIAGLRARLDQAGLDAALLWQSRDLLYYAGSAEPGMLLVWPGGWRLFVRGSLERVRRDSWLDPAGLAPQRDQGRILAEAASLLPHNAVVGTELDVLPVIWWQAWQGRVPAWRWRDVSPLVLAQRMVKDAGEVAAMRAACRAAHAGHLAALDALREGMTELELSAAVEDAQRRAGHEGVFFMRHPDFFMARGLMTSGEGFMDNSGVAYSITGQGLSPAVPAGASRRTIARGRPVLIDIPPQVAGYHADFARSYLVGRASPELRRAQEALEALYDFAALVIRPGRAWADCWRIIHDEAARLGVGDAFQALPGGGKLNYIGHGVGLELNEPPQITPRNQEPVTAGAVLAIEMHLLAGPNAGLKMEDMLWVGPEDSEYIGLTPRRLFEVD
ncbi:MAG: M24 family metallopeptidase [Thermodesulfobacteriota bacterium]